MVLASDGGVMNSRPTGVCRCKLVRKKGALRCFEWLAGDSRVRNIEALVKEKQDTERKNKNNRGCWSTVLSDHCAQCCAVRLCLSVADEPCMASYHVTEEGLRSVAPCVRRCVVEVQRTGKRTALYHLPSGICDPLETAGSQERWNVALLGVV